MLIDTHCHLDFKDFAEERDQIIERALDAGVKQMITISTRVKRSQLPPPQPPGRRSECPPHPYLALIPASIIHAVAGVDVGTLKPESLPQTFRCPSLAI